jgi:hypothetical protein
MDLIVFREVMDLVRIDFLFKKKKGGTVLIIVNLSFDLVRVRVRVRYEIKRTLLLSQHLSGPNIIEKGVVSLKSAKFIYSR